MDVDCSTYERSGYRYKRDTSEATTGSNATHPETNSNTNPINVTEQGEL